MRNLPPDCVDHPEVLDCSLTNRFPADSRPSRTLKEWIAAFIENDVADYYNELYEGREDDDDFMASVQSDQGDGYYDDLDLDIDDSLLEGLLIVGLALTLLFLVYVRQQQQRNRENANAANQAANGNNGGNEMGNNNNNDRGFFPQPGDPEFGQWVAGGVGH